MFSIIHGTFLQERFNRTDVPGDFAIEFRLGRHPVEKIRHRRLGPLRFHGPSSAGNVNARVRIAQLFRRFRRRRRADESRENHVRFPVRSSVGKDVSREHKVQVFERNRDHSRHAFRSAVFHSPARRSTKSRRREGALCAFGRRPFDHVERLPRVQTKRREPKLVLGKLLKSPIVEIRG